MDATASHKKRLVEPRLVIRKEANLQVDDAVKTLIVEWIVPALVEEYIRVNPLGVPNPHEQDASMYPLKGQDELWNSGRTSLNQKSDPLAMFLKASRS